MSASWLQSIKDNSRRMKQEFMQTIGVTDATVDPAFDARVRKFGSLNETCVGLSLATKSYLDAMQNFINASTVLVNEFAVFFEVQQQRSNRKKEDSAIDLRSMNACANQVKRIHIAMDQQVRQTIEEVLKAKVLSPINDLSYELQEISTKLEKRKEKLLDFDAFRRLLESKKNSPDIDRHREKMSAAEESLQQISMEISEHFDDLDARSSTLFQNEFVAFVGCQSHWLERSSFLIKQFIPFLPSISSTIADLAYLSPTTSGEMPGVVDYEGWDITEHIKKDADVKKPLESVRKGPSSHPAIQLVAIEPFSRMHIAQGMPKDLVLKPNIVETPPSVAEPSINGQNVQDQEPLLSFN